MTGRWTLAWELGSGAGGEVFLARAADGTRGALKRARPGAEPRLERERRLLARGLHPAFPALLDPGTEGWLVMELVEGRGVAGLPKPVPPGTVARIGAALCAALAALHAAGVVHRDVAARNLVLDDAGRLRVLDLGAAAVAGEVGLTRDGAIVGTGDRASLGEEGPALDLFATGGLLLDLLAGADGGPVTMIAHQLRAVDPRLRLPAAVAAAELARHADDPSPPDRTLDAAEVAPAVVPLPERLGRYRVLEVLGRGGMGVVYRAWDPELRRAVALKVHTTGDPRRFAREARAVAALEHPSVVRVLDVGTDGGTAYLALELVEGPTLADRLAAGPIPLVDLVRWVADVAEGLGRAHVQGVVHRDVKPSNVLLGDGARARITDFGLARPADPSAEVTRAGVLLGTPRYMAPEQATGGAVGPAADVYALGLVLYEGLAGAPAWPGEDPLRVLAALTNGPSPAPPPGAPAELRKVVRKAMAELPAERYPDAAALAADLRRFARGEPVTAEPITWPRAARGFARRHGTALRAAAVAGLVVAGLAGAARAASVGWAQREQAGREAAAVAALARAGTGIAALRAEGREAEADALFAATAADPALEGTRAVADAWLAEAAHRTATRRPDDAVRALGQAWLATPDERRGEVLLALADALADAGRWEGRVRVAPLLERHAPDVAASAAGRAVLRDRDAWLGLPGPGGDGLDGILARLGRVRPVPADPADRPDDWIRTGPDGRPWVVAVDAVTPLDSGLRRAGDRLDRAAFAARGGFRGAAAESGVHAWWGSVHTVPVGDGELVSGAPVVLRGPDGATRPADPWVAAIGGEGGPAAALDADGDGDLELAVATVGWGLSVLHVVDASGAPLALHRWDAEALAPVTIGDRQHLVVVPHRHRRSAVVFPDADPRRFRGLHVIDLLRPEAPGWSVDVGACNGARALHLDGDGRQDLVAECAAGVVVARQEPGGGFEATVLGGLALRGLLDLDRDGRMDLVVGDEAHRRWVFGVGDGTRPGRPLPPAADDPDPSVRAALELDDLGLRADAVARLEAVALGAADPALAARALRLAAERSWGDVADRRFRASLAAVDDPATRGAAARAAAAERRLPEALAWAEGLPDDAAPERAAWRSRATAPTSGWTFPAPLDPRWVVETPDGVRLTGDALRLDSADDEVLLRIPVRVVDPVVQLGLRGTLDRLEWAGGFSASLETPDGRSLGALRLRGTGGGRHVDLGLRCALPTDAQERVLAAPLPAPDLTGTFWWARDPDGVACGVDAERSEYGPVSGWPDAPFDAWWVLRAHGEAGTPRTTLRVAAVELRGVVPRDPGRRSAPAGARSEIVALDEAGRAAEAGEALRRWLVEPGARWGWVRTRPHWLGWLPPATAAEAVLQATPQLHQHLGDPQTDGVLLALAPSLEGRADGDAAILRAGMARATPAPSAARYHADLAFAAALAVPEPHERQGLLGIVLPEVVAIELRAGDPARAAERVRAALDAAPFPELLADTLRRTPGFEPVHAALVR